MTVRTRVKICGITRREDAVAAVRAGADAVGFVFVAGSPRAIDVTSARRIAAVLPAFVTPVGLFLDAPDDEVRAAIGDWPELVPQFHGNESAADCERHGRRYLKAIGVGEAGMLPEEGALAPFTGAGGFLFDSHAPGEQGGTGRTFDWSALAARPPGTRPLILAGGLHPDNVAEAVRRVAPWAVDVSSGVESAKGIKDHGAMRAFVAAVRAADEGRRDAPPNESVPDDGT